MNRNPRNVDARFFLIYVVCSLALIFYLPSLVSLSPNTSDSYTFGYNNRAGIALLFLLLTIGAVWTKGMNLELRTAGVSRPVGRKVFIVSLMGVLSGCLAMDLLVGRFGGFGESSYGIDRVWLLSQGRTPYLDFEWAYGASLLYGPLMLRNLLHINLFQGYYLVWIISCLLGTWLLYQVINMVDYPSDAKQAIFLLLYGTGFPFILYMGAQYTFLRYVLPLFFILVVQKLLRGGGAKSRAKAILLSVAFTLILLLISPETSIAFAFACICVFVLFAPDRRGTSIAIFAGLALALAVVFWIAMKLHALDSVKAFGGGADSIPIFIAPHILVFFWALFVCACYVYRCFSQRRFDDNTIGLIAFSIPMIAAALGKCDPGHVVWNGLGFFMASMFYLSNHKTAWRWYKAAFVIVLILYPAVSMTLFYNQFFQKARLDSLRESSNHSQGEIDLSSLYPSWHGTFLAPFGYQPNGLGSYLSNQVDYGRFDGFENAYTVEAIDTKLAEIKNHPEKALLLPNDFESSCQTNLAVRRLAIGIFFGTPYFGRAVHPQNLRKPVCDYILSNYKLEQQPEQQNFDYGLWIVKSVKSSL